MLVGWLYECYVVKGFLCGYIPKKLSELREFYKDAKLNPSDYTDEVFLDEIEGTKALGWDTTSRTSSALDGAGKLKHYVL